MSRMQFAVGDLVFCADQPSEEERFVMCSYGPDHWVNQTSNHPFLQPELKSLKSIIDPVLHNYKHYYGTTGIITRAKAPKGKDSKGIYEIFIEGTKYIAQDYVLHRHMTTDPLKAVPVLSHHHI
ncbi:MAG TPA: hypothetical protein DCX27_08565 [Balneola sp.]|nr:hypothetical protein [Balneola sp.]